MSLMVRNDHMDKPLLGIVFTWFFFLPEGTDLITHMTEIVLLYILQKSYMATTSRTEKEPGS